MTESTLIRLPAAQLPLLLHANIANLPHDALPHINHNNHIIPPTHNHLRAARMPRKEQARIPNLDVLDTRAPARLTHSTRPNSHIPQPHTPVLPRRRQLPFAHRVPLNALHRPAVAREFLTALHIRSIRVPDADF